ncbi:hypothetical protein PRIPAC_85318, partial [Pristionchus pacificus]|uniref:Uncharacterized protein n=1 Tax=Pristionchus pacificus TaxID=54126 RepID=A0A2A6CCG0_PRIPA
FQSAPILPSSLVSLRLLSTTWIEIGRGWQVEDEGSFVMISPSSLLAIHTGDDVIDGAFTIDDVPIAERDVAGELAGATKIERAEVVLLEGT